jgi:putative hemolysin
MSDHLTPIPWLDVLLILALVTLNGVLAMSELAIVSSREARLKAMAKGGSRGAQCALDLSADPGRFLRPGSRRSISLQPRSSPSSSC